MRLLLSLLVVVTLCVFLDGCGYRLAKYGEGHLVSGEKAIGILLFTNKSTRPNLEAVLTAALVDEFALRSGGKVVTESSADLLLSGTIDSYAEVPVSYTSLDLIKEYRASIAAKVVLRDKASQKVLWKGDVNETQTFPSFADSSPLQTNIPLQENIGAIQQNNVTLLQNTEDAAVKEMCRKLAQRIYQKISEDF